MGLYSNAIPVVGPTTLAASGVSARSFNLGEYQSGLLAIYVSSLGGTSAILPRWEWSPNGGYNGSGYYISIKAFATAIAATGLSVATLPFVLGWGRPGWRLRKGDGTPTATVQMWLVGQGQK